ncbi:GTP binding protein [Naegleria gruberi]|uniref:GTP binding protein n=1 Tax=Naegleria gruberi TaxID=5762 RepID=D2VF35_NAEGR|nr:GTP binding protein [Naegleria gruberi]EFC44707.1 GTP binding protein [Naegleria gruberi]|eukprot:XP_002677451.1 GTP binding protein [Naegleria gruberi strain NEG-M]
MSEDKVVVASSSSSTSFPSSSSGTQLIDASNSKTKVLLTDIVYEYQTRRVFGDFQPAVKSGVYKTADFKDITFSAVEKKATEGGWSWLSKEWTSEGEDSWEYCHSWSDDSKSWSHAYNSLFDFARRKQWSRIRSKYVEKSEVNSLQTQFGENLTIVDKDENSRIIYSQVNQMKEQLSSDCSTIAEKTSKPNILLLGGSGSGKSSLVNAVFGKSLAEIGEGKPVTQQYTKYAGEHSPVVIYDSRGIEHGYIQDGFVADTRRFFKKIRGEKDLAKHVHVVWYVLDLTQARFQPFEAEFCRDELKGIPIIFVLNKADAVKNQIRDIMIDTIANFNLPNCIGIYPTVAFCKNFDTKECPSCGSTKIRKRLKAGTCTIMCKECNGNITLEKTMGIDRLSRSTMLVLPDLVKSVFVNAQQSSTLGKELKAKDIILENHRDLSLTKVEKVKKNLVSMITALTGLYEVDSLLSLIQQKMSSRFDKFYKEQGFSKRLHLFMSDAMTKRETNAEVFMLCAGIEICNTIIKFKQSAIAHAMKSFETQVSEERKEEEEKEESKGAMPMQNNVTVVETKKTASYASIHDLDEEGDEDLYIDKLIANVHFTVDSAIVEMVSHELRKVRDAKKYLEMIAFNGQSSFIPTEKKVEIQEEEELHIPLYTYQKSKEGEGSNSEQAPTTAQQ